MNSSETQQLLDRRRERQSKLRERHAGRFRGVNIVAKRPERVVTSNVQKTNDETRQVNVPTTRSIQRGHRNVSQAKAERAKRLARSASHARYKKQEAKPDSSFQHTVDSDPFETQLSFEDPQNPPGVKLENSLDTTKRVKKSNNETHLASDGRSLQGHPPPPPPPPPIRRNRFQRPSDDSRRSNTSVSVQELNTLLSPQNQADRESPIDPSSSRGNEKDGLCSKSSPERVMSSSRPKASDHAYNIPASAAFEKRLALFEKFSRNEPQQPLHQPTRSPNRVHRVKEQAFSGHNFKASTTTDTKKSELFDRNEAFKVELSQQECSPLSPRVLHDQDEVSVTGDFSSPSDEANPMEQSFDRDASQASPTSESPMRKVAKAYSTDTSEGEPPVLLIPKSAVESGSYRDENAERIVTPEPSTSVRRSPDESSVSVLNNELFLYEGSQLQSATNLDRTLPDLSAGDSPMVAMGRHAESAFVSVSNPRFGIPVGGPPNESLEYSMIASVDVSGTGVAPESAQFTDDISPKQVDGSFDTDTTSHFTPSPKLAASSFSSTSTDTTDDTSRSCGVEPKDIQVRKEILMVSREYVEVCLQDKEFTILEENDDDVNDLFKHNLLHDLAVTAKEDLPFIVHQLKQEVKEIKKDFRSLGDDISDTAAEIRGGPSSILMDCCSGYR